ncbi:CHAT domain-containing protein [Streptomyces bambusae]|uniref:CHAT domain-containing protein n=1 Tax=Streptomyces bambusae TaxID=1550616 RepID=UPI001CFD88C8|nr:CHAT domain-containing protein [Streptomyces bambusae]MCB5165845.1 CHAT domain-containing protein [Streptomyces bambusae]
MSGSDSGGVRGLRAWAEEAGRKAARLMSSDGPAAPVPADFDGPIAELDRILPLLDHEPALRHRLTVVLALLLTRRLLAGGGTEDRQRALNLVAEAREPRAGVTLAPEEEQVLAAAAATLALPVADLGAVAAGKAPSVTEVAAWTLENPGGLDAFLQAVRAMASAPEALVPLGDELRLLAQMLGGPGRDGVPADSADLLRMLPDGHPLAGQLRAALSMLDMLGGAGGFGPGSGQGAPAPADPAPQPPVRPPLPAPAPPGAPGTTSGAAPSDPSTPSEIALHALLPAGLALMQVLQSREPEELDHALALLDAAEQRMPADDPMTRMLSSVRAGLLQMAPAAGGTVADGEAGRALAARPDVTSDPQAGAWTGPGAVPLQLMRHASAVFGARGADDLPALDTAIAHLTTMAAGLAPDGEDTALVHILLAQADMTRGRLAGDTGRQLSGADRLLDLTAHADRVPPHILPYLPRLTDAARHIRAGLTGDAGGIRHLEPPGPDAAPTAWAEYGTKLAARHEITHDPDDLDRAVDALTLVRRAVAAGRSAAIAADSLWQLSLLHQRRWHGTRLAADAADATATALEALQALAADVALQTGAGHGLLVARAGSRRAVDAARWAGSQGRPGEAVTALELGRAMVLRAAATSAGVPELLEQRGRPDLAAAWRRPAGASGPGGPATLPSRLRRQALEALGYREGRLFPVPTVSELTAGVADCDADALVYLMPGSGPAPGMALVIGPDCGTCVIGLPLLTERHSGPLHRYRAALRERSRTPDGPEAERAWEAALTDVCDWSFRAALGPVLAGMTERIAANAARRPRTGTPRIVLVPCGDLGIVPWHAGRLPAGAPGDYVCQFMAVSYAASGGQFLSALTRDRRPAAAAPVLLADPGFDLTFAAPEALALHEACYPGARLLGGFYDVEPEADGTPEEVLGLLDQPLSVLHLACHGSAGDDPAVSALCLAPPEGAGAGTGALTVTRLLAHAADSAGRDRATGPLVVLSACETDLGKGDHDEALTLATAFVAAGARDVVGSRWTVHDGASALLMAVFHHHVAVEGRTPADALRAAQNWMLDPDRRAPAGLSGDLLRELERPGLDRLTLWAAFTHQGNPGPAGGAAAPAPEPPAEAGPAAAPVAPEQRLLDLVAEHLDGIRDALGDSGHALLRGRLEALAADPGDPRTRRKALYGVRLALLSLPPGHPVRLALDLTRRTQDAPGPDAGDGTDAVAGARRVLALMADPAAEQVSP